LWDKCQVGKERVTKVHKAWANSKRNEKGPYQRLGIRKVFLVALTVGKKTRVYPRRGIEKRGRDFCAGNSSKKERLVSSLMLRREKACQV